MGIPWEWEFPFPCTPLDASYKTHTEYQNSANKFTRALLIVLLKDDKLLK